MLTLEALYLHITSTLTVNALITPFALHALVPRLTSLAFDPVICNHLRIECILIVASACVILTI